MQRLNKRPSRGRHCTSKHPASLPFIELCKAMAGEDAKQASPLVGFYLLRLGFLGLDQAECSWVDPELLLLWQLNLVSSLGDGAAA